MNIIEQADRIVGIDTALGLGGILDQADPADRNTYRRGAYLEFYGKHSVHERGNALCDTGAHNYSPASASLEKMAEVVVALHAATKSKGDGLPEVDRVTSAWFAGKAKCATVWMNSSASEEETEAMVSYISRCLSSPVRRLLAEYEVYDHDPLQGVMTRVCQHRGDPIYLVSKASKS